MVLKPKKYTIHVADPTREEVEAVFTEVVKTLNTILEEANYNPLTDIIVEEYKIKGGYEEQGPVSVNLPGEFTSEEGFDVIEATIEEKLGDSFLATEYTMSVTYRVSAGQLEILQTVQPEEEPEQETTPAQKGPTAGGRPEEVYSMLKDITKFL